MTRQLCNLKFGLTGKRVHDITVSRRLFWDEEVSRWEGGDLGALLLTFTLALWLFTRKYKKTSWNWSSSRDIKMNPSKMTRCYREIYIAVLYLSYLPSVTIYKRGISRNIYPHVVSPTQYHLLWGSFHPHKRGIHLRQPKGQQRRCNICLGFPLQRPFSHSPTRAYAGLLLACTGRWTLSGLQGDVAQLAGAAESTAVDISFVFQQPGADPSLWHIVINSIFTPSFLLQSSAGAQV